MALRRLRGVRPSTARQLYTSIVTDDRLRLTSVVPDGVSEDPGNGGTSTEDRAVTVISGFRTIALPIAEAEAAIDTTQAR